MVVILGRPHHEFRLFTPPPFPLSVVNNEKEKKRRKNPEKEPSPKKEATYSSVYVANYCCERKTPIFY
jgi:hypothetical protein